MNKTMESTWLTSFRSMSRAGASLLRLHLQFVESIPLIFRHVLFNVWWFWLFMSIISHAEWERRTNGQTVRARQKQRGINFNVLTIPLGFRHCLLTDFDLSCRRNGFRLRWSEKISDERKRRRRRRRIRRRITRKKENDCNRSNYSRTGTRKREREPSFAINDQ